MNILDFAVTLPFAASTFFVPGSYINGLITGLAGGYLIAVHIAPWIGRRFPL